MMNPHEIKFQLDRKLLALAQGGRVPVISSIHSVVVEGNTVHVGYDLLHSDRDVLFFEFEQPQLVSRDDITAFATWLAWSDLGETGH
jgi:hypothetical protein